MLETTPTTSDVMIVAITNTSSRLDYAFTRVSSIVEIIAGKFRSYKLTKERACDRLSLRRKKQDVRIRVVTITNEGKTPRRVMNCTGSSFSLTD